MARFDPTLTRRGLIAGAAAVTLARPAFAAANAAQWTKADFEKAMAASGRPVTITDAAFDAIQKRRPLALKRIEAYLKERLGSADPAVMAAFWKYMFDAQWGLINFLTRDHRPWIGFTPRSFWAVVIVEVWMWTPFMMLLSLAGLSSVPKALYEAAQVDRASAWFRFRNITLPLVSPLLLLGIVFRTMDTFRLFDTPHVLNGSIPGQPTTFVSVLLYIRGIKNSSDSLGQATALAYLLLIVAVALGNLAVHTLDKMRHPEGAPS